VDTENVGTHWKELLEKSTKYDRILLFYTDNSPYVSYPDLEYICRHTGSFEMIACHTGRNALDFQLVSYLGFLLKSAPKTRYVIFSNDNGYDAVIRFWSAREIHVSRVSVDQLLSQKTKAEEKPVETKAPSVSKQRNVKHPPAVQAEPKSKKPSVRQGMVESIVNHHVESKEDANKVTKILLTENLNDLREIHNDLVKSFGMEAGSDLYKKIKPDIHKLKK